MGGCWSFCTQVERSKKRNSSAFSLIACPGGESRFGSLHSSGNPWLSVDPDRCTSLNTARPHCLATGWLTGKLNER